MQMKFDLFNNGREFREYCNLSSPGWPDEAEFLVRTLRNHGSSSARAMQIASIIQETRLRSACSPHWMKHFKMFWNDKIKETLERVGGDWVIVRIVDTSDSRQTDEEQTDLWDRTHASLDAKLYAAGITAALGGLGLTLRPVGQHWFYQPHAVLYIRKREVIGGRQVLRRLFAANEFVRRPVTVMPMCARLGPKSRTIDAVFYANGELGTRKSLGRNAYGGSADIASAILRAGATAQIYTHNFRLEEAADGAVRLRRSFRLPN